MGQGHRSTSHCERASEREREGEREAMGNTQSPSTDPRFVSASRAFTPNELGDLKSLFVSLAAQSHSNGRYISPSVFKAYIGTHGPLGDRLYDLITWSRNDQKLTFEDLIIAKGTYEKGSQDEVEDFIYRLSDVNGDGILGRSDVESVLKAVLSNISSKEGSNHRADSFEEIVRLFSDVGKFSNNSEEGAEKGMSLEDFRSWCSLLPSVSKFLVSLLIPSDRGFQVPPLIYQENIDPSMMVLNDVYTWHIGGALSQHELLEWKLLYHSSVDGLSFNTFFGKISNCEGPSVLIIKDKEGHIYGGYASQPWERHADFYGDMKSFLFHLYPRASIYRPTGANTNIQWCAVNFTSESIPNGIGFGGRANHFGLFLSASFDQGHTFSCTTFGSPCLSATSRIVPHVIECWGVVAVGAQPGRQDGIKGTILERYKEDRNMLNMVGLANSSD